MDSSWISYSSMLRCHLDTFAMKMKQFFYQNTRPPEKWCECFYGGSPVDIRTNNFVTVHSHGVRYWCSTQLRYGFEYSCTILVQDWRSSLFIQERIEFALFHKYEVCLIAICIGVETPWMIQLNPEKTQFEWFHPTPLLEIIASTDFSLCLRCPQSVTHRNH